ncbi:DUF3631 domain-containing protein [Legionella bozemanae]|uniref:DUF3631 domain-containing protein n=1 Tax=Legionella bozemanae TaxID=447 RepID=UPI0010412A23|nr:DUF3631 domain-containing protein [Legionella bozemanae]
MNYKDNGGQEEVVQANNNTNESTESGKKNLENIKSFLSGEKEKNDFLQTSDKLAKEGNFLKNDNFESLKKVSDKKSVSETPRFLERRSGIEDVEPYPEPIDPNVLLLEIEHIIRQVIICDEETAIATTLWIVMSWCIDHIQVAPLAVITAPEKRCGKSQLLSLIGRLVRRPLSTSNISPSALFRSIESWRPTILIDEADTFIKDNEDLRGMLNSGHTRESAFVIRTVGKDHVPHQFNIWGAKAIAGIGHLSDTLMDRAINLELRRKLEHEHVIRLRHMGKEKFNILTRKLARFSIDYKNAILSSRPNLPSALNDREQDNWEALLSIADIAGHEWSHRARNAALKISKNNNSPTTSIGVELLTSINDIFEGRSIHRISSSDLIKELCADEEQPWATYNRGQPITPRQIANLLKGYGIKSKSIRINCGTPKGFEKSKFIEAFDRYLTMEEECNKTYPFNREDYSVSYD